MFTGLIETRGTVTALTQREQGTRLQILSPHVLEGSRVGDSIAVNGCCLTVTAHDGQTWTADLMTTTLEATTLGTLAVGSRVNLERAVRTDSRLAGHLVQGHVDGLAQVTHRAASPDQLVLALRLPDYLVRFVVPKGSIALDGVSLTVVDVADSVVTVSLVAHTLQVTTLGDLQVGDVVNVETDVLAKYVANLTEAIR